MADHFTDPDRAWFEDVPAPPVPALQNVNEIGHLWEFVAARPHDRVLEIGSLYGGTLWYWSHLPAIEALVSIDLPPPPDVDIYDDVMSARENWSEWFHRDGCRFVGFDADSQDPRIAGPVATACEGWVDFAFIDGDHSYEGVARDWDRWKGLVRPGGIIAFHDTWPGSVVNVEPGVARFVDELRRVHPSVEFTDPDGVGICAFEMPR